MNDPSLSRPKLLIIDDDQNLLHVLKLSLEQEGYQVICTSEGQEALYLVRTYMPDVVVLDIMMPSIDGWEVCRRLRTISDVPIIFLSARGHEEDIVKGLDGGADDYLVKPFSLAELKARLEAVLRRATSPQEEELHYYEDGVLCIDLDAHAVYKRGQPISLSPKEFQLLACLLRHRGEVVPHATLLYEVWGPEYIQETQYLSLYIRYLRKKLEDDPSNPRYILTRVRVGYYFNFYPPQEDAEEKAGKE